MAPGDTIEEEKDYRPARVLWAYSYQMVPPRVGREMKAIDAFLDEEQSEARRSSRTWVGKLVSEQRVTHILIVTDSLDESGNANDKLEGRLKQLKLDYSRTAPMPVSDVSLAESPTEDRPPA